MRGNTSNPSNYGLFTGTNKPRKARFHSVGRRPTRIKLLKTAAIDRKIRAMAKR